MASTHILLHIWIFLLFGTIEGNSFVKIQCKTQTIGQYDHYSLLNCVVNTTEDVKDPEIQAVVWAKEDVEEPVLVFNDEKLTSSSSRYMFAEPSWNNRNLNVSLLIRKTATKDGGLYKCTVYTDSGTNVGGTSLKVTAKHSKPTFEPYPENFNLNTGGSLTCKSSGYPAGRLHWFDKDNKEWTRSPATEVEKTESGLISLSSTMIVSPGSLFSKYICRVFNAGGEPEAENSYTVIDSPSSKGQIGKESDSSTVATKVVAPVVVIGSLIVGLLLWLLLMYRRRCQQARRHSATPLISERHAVPQSEFDEDETQEMKKIAEV